jgi:hypothetical protein
VCDKDRCTQLAVVGQQVEGIVQISDKEPSQSRGNAVITAAALLHMPERECLCLDDGLSLSTYIRVQSSVPSTFCNAGLPSAKVQRWLGGLLPRIDNKRLAMKHLRHLNTHICMEHCHLN